jgi:hypothetical protein
MSPPDDKKPPSPWLLALNPKVMNVGASVGCVTVVIVLVSVLGGIWLDNLLGTKPLITVSLVLASAPLSLVLTFWIATRAVKDMPTLTSVKKEAVPKAMEGDEEE